MRTKHKITLRLNPALEARLRNAQHHAMHGTTLQDLLEVAVLNAVEALEAEYNHGEPFPDFDDAGL